MNSGKRDWIYAGLVLVAGVGLVSMAAPKGSQFPSPVPPGTPQPNPNPNPSLAPSQFSPLNQSDRILLVGDSLAQGLSTPLKKLSSGSSVAFFSDGKVGTRINQWASQWLTQDISSYKPTFILVSLGTNDMKMSDPSSESNALQVLSTILKSSNATVIWINPPTMPFSDNGVRAMIASTPFVKFQSELLTIPRGPDQIHPTSAGFAGWSGMIWGFLNRGGANSALGKR